MTVNFHVVRAEPVSFTRALLFVLYTSSL